MSESRQNQAEVFVKDLERTKVPEELASAFRRRARAAGCTPADLLRDLICVVEHGVTFGELEVNHRRQALNLQALQQTPSGGRNSG